MKKIFLLLVLVLFMAAPARAEGETMQKLYIVPIEVVNLSSGAIARGTKYIAWRFNETGIQTDHANMDYGYVPYMLVYCPAITQADHDSLVSHADVYAFPDNLDVPITNKSTLDAFFEPINVPTDWLTPSTTYRQFLRYTAALFQFNQAYHGIAAEATGEQRSIFDNGRTLDSQWNTLSAQEKGWFNEVLVRFGWLSGVQGNPKLRALAKQAGDIWGTRPFHLGGFDF